MQDGFHVLRILLLFFPRFGVGEVFVTEPRQVHQFGLRFAELVMFDALPYPVRKFGHLFDDFFLVIGEFTAFGDDSAVVFVRQNHGSVHEVPKNGEQFVVVFRLEIGPSEVGILGFRRDRSQRITQNVLSSREILDIFVCPHGPVPGSGNFVAFEVQKFVGGDVGRQDVVAVRFQHAREDDAVEDDVVFSDEMHKF